MRGRYERIRWEGEGGGNSEGVGRGWAGMGGVWEEYDVRTSGGGGATGEGGGTAVVVGGAVRIDKGV